MLYCICNILFFFMQELGGGLATEREKASSNHLGMKRLLSAYSRDGLSL